MIVEQVARADGKGPGHQKPGPGNMTFAVGLTSTPATLENRLAFVVFLPAYLAEGIKAVGRLINCKPVFGPLRQKAIHILLLLDHGSFEFADAGKIKILSLVKDDSFLAIMSIRMIRPIMNVFVSGNDWEIERVGPVWDDILSL